MTISMWIEKNLEDGTLAENQIIVVYNKNNNIVYIGKAEFAPIALWDEFVRTEMVGNELHINERAIETTEDDAPAYNISEVIQMLDYIKESKFINARYCFYGYYYVSILRDKLKNMYNIDIYEIEKIEDDLVKKEIIKFAKSGKTFKILV